MNPGQKMPEREKAREDSTSKSELSEKARPLFVCGCPRSGTTAFADYLNRHQEVLLCQERYKMGTPRERIAPDLFTFERILDFRPGETERPPDLFDLFAFKRLLDFRPEETKRPTWKKLELFIRYHTELLAEKDPAKLKWIGDKGPFYVRSMDVLASNNPGARFIVLYRPIEEVVESWEARAKDPDDHWKSELGTEVAVKAWNIALRKTREFVESSPAPRLLIVGYHDFFYRTESVVPLVSRFLGVEFDESVTRAWREASLGFEGGRRHKEPLGEEQRSFVEEHADREAEGWVLDRIEKQWREPGLYVEESEEGALASLGEMEAMVWRLKRHLEELREQNRREVKKRNRSLMREQKKNRKLRQKNRNLTHRLRSMQATRIWRLLNRLGGVWSRVPGRKR